MSCQYTFIIKYEPFERIVHFSYCNRDGHDSNIAEGEEIKEYENNIGIFTLEGQHEKIFKYICENFDGQEEVAIKIEVSEVGYNKMKTEFDRFEKVVEKHNKKNEKLKLSLEVNKIFSINIAVLGKISSGKTDLISGMINHLGSKPDSNENKNGITKYCDKVNNINWYEIDGMEIYGIDHIYKIIYQLINESTISAILYCLRSRIGKIEDVESELIVKLKKEYPQVKILVVITECMDDDTATEFANLISTQTNNSKVIAVMEKEKITKSGSVKPFGLDNLARELRLVELTK